MEGQELSHGLGLGFEVDEGELSRGFWLGFGVEGQELSHGFGLGFGNVPQTLLAEECSGTGDSHPAQCFQQGPTPGRFMSAIKGFLV